MPLELPNLDDLTWQQLTELGRSSIPGWAPDWTNHNAADPGITLIELFAYLSEMLIYRLNRISAANMWAFLRLINGPEWKPMQDLERARRETLEDLRKIRRAVTEGDFERLALATNDLPGSATNERVARAKAIFRRRLEGDNPASSSSDAPGYVSVIVVPNREDGSTEPSEQLLATVRRALEPARLLTTRVCVVGPRYLDFTVHATLVISSSVHARDVREAAIKALKSFFDPLRGGPRSSAWPLGRSLYVSEVYELLASLPGVETVKRNRDLHTGRVIDELVVSPSQAGRRRLNEEGRLEAIHVEPDELLHLEIKEDDMQVVGSNQGQGME